MILKFIPTLFYYITFHRIFQERRKKTRNFYILHKKDLIFSEIFSTIEIALICRGVSHALFAPARCVFCTKAKTVNSAVPEFSVNIRVRRRNLPMAHEFFTSFY